MAALQGQMQYMYQATANSVMGMSTVHVKVQDHTPSMMLSANRCKAGVPAFFHPFYSTAIRKQRYLQQRFRTATTGGCNGSGHGSRTSNGLFCPDADAAYMQKVQVLLSPQP